MGRLTSCFAAFCICASLAFAADIPSDAVKLEKPIAASVYKKEGNKQIAGDLLWYTGEHFVVKTPGSEMKLAWTDVTPTSAFQLRSRLINKNLPDDWLELGRFGMSLGATKEANNALDKAVSLDKALKKRADAIRQQELLSPAGPPGTRAPAVKPKDIKYEKATPEQAAESMAAARKDSAEVAKQLKIELTELETPHFICFTNWDKKEFDFLKKNLEKANEIVSKQFDISVRDNVFVGKLPIYMFNKIADFEGFASKVDDMPGFKARANGGIMLGYFKPGDDGAGHMVMWKPMELYEGAGGSLRDAEEQWAYTLTHEFTHAFVHRYRSNRNMPRWLHEGLAEVIACQAVPQKSERAMARRLYPLAKDIFNPRRVITAYEYPVLNACVEMMIEADRKAFLQFFKDIKDGVEAEKSLRTNYKTDYLGLEQKLTSYLKDGG